MITLHTFAPAFGQPDPSPFVVKAMILLQLAGQPYTTARYKGGPHLGPKGKRPFIDDDGVTVADSTLIRFHLEQKYGVAFDAHLNAAQQGVTWALEKMCEEHLYFAAVYYRWAVEANFNKGPALFFNQAPALLRPLIRWAAQRKVRRTLIAQGLGRHSEPEIAHLACRDIDALAHVLGDAAWFGGEAPCAADASIGAFTMACLCEVFDSPLLPRVHTHPNLVAYAQRVQHRFFG